MPLPSYIRPFRLSFLASLLLCALLGAGCGAKTKAPDEFSIHGKINGMGGKLLSLERITPSKSEPIQEVTPDADGSFSLVAKSEPNTLFQLRAQDGQRILLYPETDALEILADARYIESFEVNGSPKTTRLRDFNLKQYRLYMAYKMPEAQLDGLNRFQDSLAWHRLEGTTDSAMIAYNSFLHTYCDTVTLPLLRAHAALSVSPAGNYDYLQRLTQRISQETPGSAYATYLDAANKREVDGRVTIVAPELAGTDLHAQPFSLTSLRGHRVLLMFWASYCVYSQVELAQLKSMQAQFAAKGTQLVLFSIDDSPAAWKAYLQTAGLDWATHLRGLNGQQSEEIKRFRVKAIPTTYLINADGLIETMDIRAKDLQGRL